MAISQIPAPSSSGGEESAFAATIAAVERTYEHEAAFPAGVYEIAITPTTTDAQIIFATESSILVSVGTTSGVVATTLSSAATRVFITAKTGGTANAVVTITKTASAMVSGDIGNGTLDTINTTGTYNQTGLLGVLAFGGGHAGAKGGLGYTNGGAGGASGGIALGFVYNNGATTVTVGAKGTAATSNNTNLVAPNQSSFGNLLTSTNTGYFPIAAGGSAGATNNLGTAGNATLPFASFNGSSTTGSGGGGSGIGNSNAGSRSGGGSGIGTGGTSGVQINGNNPRPNVGGSAGTGKASGGGGGVGVNNDGANDAGRFGGDGADGVVYILRGF
jgi:hypothetical protein